jgi:hypothetical protein
MGPVSSSDERLVLLVSPDDIRVSKRPGHIPRRQGPGRRFLLQLAIALILSGIGVRILTSSGKIRTKPPNDGVEMEITPVEQPGLQVCHSEPCFSPAKIHVPTGNSYFPSFWNFANKGPIDVTYDKRAIKLNGDRVFFLGGSLHPSRATKNTWNFALDEAVQNGLNLITIYVMWAAHQPVPGMEIDWSFPDSSSVQCVVSLYEEYSCDWTLASAIREAANRGLFVHLRVGPYDCAGEPRGSRKGLNQMLYEFRGVSPPPPSCPNNRAEYNYGGIPEKMFELDDVRIPWSLTPLLSK